MVAIPLIRIEALLAAPIDVGTLLRSVGARAAEAFGVPVEHCWVTFHEIPSGYFYEGGVVRRRQDATFVSPLVTISALEGFDPEPKRAALKAVAEAVGSHLRIPVDGVHVQYVEIPKGHVYAGGRVVG